MGLPQAPKTAATPTVPRGLGAIGVLGTTLTCLVVGHLTISAFFPSLVVNGVGIALVTLILGRLLFLKRDVFAYVLTVFACSLFDYANHQGGLFNLVAFLLGGCYLLFGPDTKETKTRDPLIATLLGILLVSDLLGLLVRNLMPPFVLLLQGASFTGILLTFLIASKVYLSQARLRTLVAVFAVMATYNFVVSLNQHYSVLKIATPLLGLSKERFYEATNAFGVFLSASANGQFTMMVLVFLVPLVAATDSRKKLGVNPLFYIPVIVMCGLTIVMANMRAAALLAILAMIVYSIMFSLLYRRSFRNSKYVNRATAVAVILLVTAGTWVGLQNIQADFETVRIKSFSDIESGEGLNRGSAWAFGFHLLATENWWIGYGHGNDKSNRLAWGGKWTGSGRMSQMESPGEIIGGGHLHNLYLALPPLYGWIGAAAYVLVFLTVVARLVGAIRRYPFDYLIIATCLSFATSLGLFLIDEGKSGNAVQKINYAMVAWVWLGFGLAAFRTLKRDVASAAAQKAQQGAPGSDDPEAKPSESDSTSKVSPGGKPRVAPAWRGGMR